MINAPLMYLIEEISGIVLHIVLIWFQTKAFFFGEHVSEIVNELFFATFPYNLQDAEFL